LPTYLVSSLTRQYVTVALSGDGGDELFGGYITYQMLLRFSRVMDFVPRAFTPLADAMANVLPANSKVERRLRFVGMTDSHRFVRVVTHFRPSDKNDLYSDQTKAHLEDLQSSIWGKAQLLQNAQVSYSRRMQFADFMQYLPDDILVKVDRTSMLVSLETRAPFLDHRLVEFAFSLPGTWKITSRQSKIILRDALKDLLPAAIIRRGKAGFSVPVREWFAGPLYEFCRSRILADSMEHFFDRRVIIKLLEEHRTGRRDNSSRLWLLLCFALWVSRH